MAGTSGIRAGRAFVELGVSDKLTAGLRRAQKRLRAFGAGIRSAGMRIMAFGASIAASLAGSVKIFSSAGDQLDKVSRRTGISVEALSELGFAAEQSGTNLATLEAGVRVMQRTMGDAAQGLSTAVDAFDALGLSIEQLQGLSPENQFTLIAERLSRIADPSARASAAMDVFGRAGTRLLPLLADGAKGMEVLRQQARSLGLTVSTRTAADAALLTDTLNILWRVVKQGVFEIGAALAPTIIEASRRITKLVINLSDWIRQNQTLLVTALKITAAVVASGVALVAFGWMISGVAAAVGGLASVIAGVGAALGMIGTAVAAMLSPLGVVATAIVALGSKLLVSTGLGAQAIDWLAEQFNSLKDTVTKVVNGIAQALAAGDMTAAARILWLTLKLAWQEGVAMLNRVWLTARRFFVGTAQKMWYGALAAAQQTTHSLEVAWIETTAFMAKAWTSFTAGFRKSWNTAINWTTKRLLELQGLFDSGLDVDAAKRMADESLADTNASIDRQRDVTLKTREQQRRTQRDHADRINEATLAEIGSQFEEAGSRLERDTEARLSATREALAQARSELDEALDRVTKQTSPDAVDRPIARRLDSIFSEFENRLDLVNRRLDNGISVTGTFNPWSLLGLGASHAAERTARATEQTALHTKRIAQAASGKGLVFP